MTDMMEAAQQQAAGNVQAGEAGGQMPIVTPDFDECSAGLPEARYSARLVGVEQKTSQAGNIYLKWTLEIFGHAENPLFNGTKVWTNTPVSGRGAFRLRDLLKAAVGELPPKGAGFNPQSLLGREVDIDVVDGKDKGGQKTGFSEVKRIYKRAA